MEGREKARATEESGVSDVDDVADVEDIEDEVDIEYVGDAESNPDLEDPRLYSPLLAQDDPCLKRRRTESAAAGRSIIPCEEEAREEIIAEKPADRT